MEKMYMVTKRNKTESEGSKKIVFAYFLLLVCIAGIAFQQFEIYTLQHGQQEQRGLMQSISQNARQLKKIYVFDLEQALLKLNIADINKEFEAKIKVLNDEVSTAQKKIASLKETKDKDTFSDMYLQSLKLKRDAMLQEYTNTLESLTEEINQTVANVGIEKNASVVFDKRVIATQTEEVEDITDEVVKRAKVKRPKILDE
jgi:hypothetical protein